VLPPIQVGKSPQHCSITSSIAPAREEKETWVDAKTNLFWTERTNEASMKVADDCENEAKEVRSRGLTCPPTVLSELRSLINAWRSACWMVLADPASQVIDPKACPYTAEAATRAETKAEVKLKRIIFLY